jgi:histidine ammonia-lyase
VGGLLGLVIDLSGFVGYRDVWMISMGLASAKIEGNVIEILRKRREEFLESIIMRGERCYGVSTGVGGLKEYSVDPVEFAKRSRDFLREHAAGSGSPLDRGIVRGAMAILAKQLLNEYSAVSPEIPGLLVEMLNRDIVPIVPRYGSLGASGDLAPMAYIGLALVGEGLVEKKGRRMSAVEALKEEGLEPVSLGPKEALSIINNTAMSTSIAVHALVGAERLLKMLELGGAIAMEAMGTPGEHLDLDLCLLKRHPGVSREGERLREILEGSGDLGRSGVVQDIYSYRCIPQILGALSDAIGFVRETIDREINAVTDNPLFIKGRCVSGCNFHGISIGIAMDLLSIALIPALTQSERRVAAILDASMNRGLPPFLSKDPGKSPGLMMLQYLAASLLNRARGLAYPATVDNTPTSANHEDHVSNSLNAGLKALEIVELGMRIAAIEIMVMARALSMRSWIDSSSKRVRDTVEKILEIPVETQPLGSSVETALSKILEMIGY